MATTTTKVTRIKLKLNNTKTATINLPEPINMTLTDPNDSETSLIPAAYASIAACYADDSGGTVAAADFSIVTTTTTDIVTDYTGGNI